MSMSARSVMGYRIVRAKRSIAHAHAVSQKDGDCVGPRVE